MSLDKQIAEKVLSVISSKDYLFSKRLQESNRLLNGIFNNDAEFESVMSVGDRHYPMHINNLNTTKLDNSNYSIETKFDINYTTLANGTFFRNKKSAKLPANEEDVDFWGEDKITEMNIAKFTEKILNERIIKNDYTTDSSKLVKLEGLTNSEKVIYKPFSTVKLEKVLTDLLSSNNLFAQKFHIQKDNEGDYAWIEYIKNTPTSKMDFSSVSNKQLFNLYQQMAISYVLGAYDFNHENILWTKDEKIPLRIDYEDSFLESKNTFVEFLKWTHFSRNITFDFIHKIVRSSNSKLYLEKAIDSIVNTPLLDNLDNYVSNELLKQKLVRRTILKSTSSYKSKDRYGNIIPLFMEPITQKHVDAYHFRSQNLRKFKIESFKENQII